MRGAIAIVAVSLGACALSLACGASKPPPPPRAAQSVEPPHPPPPMEAIDVALDDIARICKGKMTPDGDCVAPTDQLCEAMERTARACFEASAEPARCNEVMDLVHEHVTTRALGAPTAKIVATFCEAVCEVKQQGHRWMDARATLDRVCGPQRAP